MKRRSQRASVLANVNVILLLVGLMVLMACKKDKVSVYDKVPEIRLEEVNATSIKQFQDSILITIEYKDGDGNVGFEHPDSLALKVLDSRLTAPDWYFVPPLSPVGEEIPVSGILTFRLNGTFLLGNGGAEKTTFHITLRDRDNNWSNEIATPEITINP